MELEHFEDFEVVKEQPMGSDVPSGECSICLDKFQKSDHFTETPCSHYFHSQCMMKLIRVTHKQYMEGQYRKYTIASFKLKCPLCRAALQHDLDSLMPARSYYKLIDVENEMWINQLRQLAIDLPKEEQRRVQRVIRQSRRSAYRRRMSDSGSTSDASLQ